MIKSPMVVTRAELGLIESLAEIEYGMLVDVEILENGDQPLTPVEVSSPTMRLLELIRSEERFFRQIRIHQSEPTLVEVPATTKAGYRGFKQIRLEK